MKFNDLITWIGVLSGKALTGCQNKRRQALLSVKAVPIPRCRPDGSYSPVQCDRPTGECWCSDDNGVEIPGTRTTGVVRCPRDGKINNIIYDTDRVSMSHYHLFFIGVQWESFLLTIKSDEDDDGLLL